MCRGNLFADNMPGAVNVTPKIDETYYYSPTVVATDWIAFIILSGSAIVIGYKLMQFKGPSDQPEDYFFGYLVSIFTSYSC